VVQMEGDGASPLSISLSNAAVRMMKLRCSALGLEKLDNRQLGNNGGRQTNLPRASLVSNEAVKTMKLS